ncbi:MAG: DUF58 domain-containing protein, partial [Mucinivorans sp.]
MKEDILKKVRRIEIKTRGLSHDIFAGKYHSAFKGRGMSFSEVRDYRIGDDIRDIDWNVTARSSKPHIKIYEEERELTMMLLVDVSGSGNFGTQTMLKRQCATEIAAVLAFSAAQNNDKIGCIFFTDRIEKYVPPKKGKQHVLRIISDLVDFQPESRGTDVGVALKFFASVVKKRCTAFLLSDLISPSFEEPLKIASGKHDLVALRVYDSREEELPNVGIIEMRDSETSRKVWVDSASRKVRQQYAESYRTRTEATERLMLKNRVDTVNIATSDDYVAALIKL